MIMTINVNTKIGTLIKHNPAALEAIVSISSAFEKLRNPLLRKLIAGRTSIAMATKIGGCTAEDFFSKLKPLGFEIESSVPENPVETRKPLPAFLTTIGKGQISELDVRPILATGKDPLKLIVEHTKALPVGQALKIINSFEPTPLMQLLGKQGFVSYADKISDDLVETWFYKEHEQAAAAVSIPDESWDDIFKRYSEKTRFIDVRALEMPQPMHAILEELDDLPSGRALFVYHKRIPVFLLPELAERGFQYRIREIKDGEVNLLIFRK